MVERVRLIEQHPVRAKPAPSIRDAINPRDAIEELYADDLSDVARLEPKLQDLALRHMSMALPPALHELLSHELARLDPTEAVNLVMGWYRGDSTAKAKVTELLKHCGLTEEDVSAHALVRVLPTLSAVESFRSQVSSRRDKALAGIAFRRQMALQEQRLPRSLSPPTPRGKPAPERRIAAMQGQGQASTGKGRVAGKRAEPDSDGQ